jgi:AAA domain
MNDPIVTPHGQSYYVTTPPVIFGFDHLRDHSEGLAAEVTATVAEGPAAGQQHWARLNLASTNGRRDFTKALLSLDAQLPCTGLLDTVCRVVVKKHRLGEPARELIAAPRPPESWFIENWIFRGQTALLFGDGGSGKSLLALALAMAGLTGQPLCRSSRWQVIPLRAVLYLDWESDYQTHAARLWGLSRMHGTGDPITNLYYRRMDRALSDSVSAVAHDVAECHCDLVIVDSLGAAAGLEPESADAAIRTLNALRSLGEVTCLVIAHVAKSQADLTTRRVPRPYGSIYVNNLPRSTIYCEAAEQVAEDEMTVTYSHAKINDAARQRRALRFSFDDGLIAVSTSEPDLSRSGLPAQILSLLKHGNQTVTSIADELSANPGSVKVTMNRLANRNKVICLNERSGGKGKESLWGLPLINRNIETETP